MSRSGIKVTLGGFLFLPPWVIVGSRDSGAAT